MEPSDFDRPSFLQSRLSDRLFDARVLVINEPMTASVSASISERLSVLEADSDEPIRVMMTQVSGGDFTSALSVYDFLQSVAAPVTMLGAGRIVGAGVVAFVGAPAERRYALPHSRFRFAEPDHEAEGGTAETLEQKVEEREELRRRAVSVLADATGQSKSQVEDDLSERRALDAEEAKNYGLVRRIVQSQGEIG